MFSLLGTLSKHLDTDAATPKQRRRNFSGDFPASSETDEPLFDRLNGSPFMAEQSYFSIRLVEMRLADPSNYLRTVIPMCSCFLRFPYGTGKREIPFVVGHDMIRTALKEKTETTGKDHIEFTNIYVVENAPVKMGSVELYTALCRVADSGFARGILDLFADAAAMVGGPAAGAVARTGVGLTKRLASLLGSDGVDTRFGMLDGNALRKSGYRVFAGADSDFNTDTLHLKQGQLLYRAPGASDSSVIDDTDYLVVAFEFQKSLVSDALVATGNPLFGKTWDAILAKIAAKDHAGVESARNQLILEIATSPDLVNADRFSLTLAYSSVLEQWQEAMQPKKSKLRSGGRGNIATRLDNLAKQETSLDPKVQKILESASGWLAGSHDRRIENSAELLSNETLWKTAQHFRTKIDQATPKRLGKNGTQYLSDATTKFVAAALAGWL